MHTHSVYENEGVQALHDDRILLLMLSLLSALFLTVTNNDF